MMIVVSLPLSHASSFPCVMITCVVSSSSFCCSGAPLTSGQWRHPPARARCQRWGHHGIAPRARRERAELSCLMP